MGRRPTRIANGPRSRGAALERLILDTSILVAAERLGTALDRLIRDDDDVAMAAITAAELLVGVELAEGTRRRRRALFVEALLEVIPLEDYDLDVARSHALLLAHACRSGAPRGAHDLIIAATGLARRRTVVTVDATGFANLPGVVVRSR